MNDHIIEKLESVFNIEFESHYHDFIPNFYLLSLISSLHYAYFKEQSEYS